MELNAYSGGHRHPANVKEKWTHNGGEMPRNRGDPSSEVAFHFLFLSWKFAHTPSAVIQRGGRVGLSSVPHGKLVAYKSYI